MIIDRLLAKPVMSPFGHAVLDLCGILTDSSDTRITGFSPLVPQTWWAPQIQDSQVHKSHFICTISCYLRTSRGPVRRRRRIIVVALFPQAITTLYSSSHSPALHIFCLFFLSISCYAFIGPFLLDLLLPSIGIFELEISPIHTGHRLSSKPSWVVRRVTMAVQMLLWPAWGTRV